MSPTFGPISMALAADTTATELASKAAIRLASTAVLTISLDARSVGLSVSLRHLMGRHPGGGPPLAHGTMKDVPGRTAPGAYRYPRLNLFLRRRVGFCLSEESPD